MTKKDNRITTISCTDKIYDFDSVIDVECKFKDLTVAEALNQDKKAVWKLIKNGLIIDFTDEVLKEANISKNVRDEKVEHVFVDKVIKKSNKVYKKDTESLENIMKSLNVLDNSDYKYDQDDDDENDEIIDVECLGEEEY